MAVCIIDEILILFPTQVFYPLLHFLTRRAAMPSNPSQFQLTKDSKRHKLMSTVIAVTIISIHSIILPLLYNNLPQPMHTSQLSGQEYMDEVLNCDNTRRCQEGFRMRPEVFRCLCSTLSCSAWQMAV